jgi:hypothetical protein
VDRIDQIYKEGLARLERAPEYHYSDSKPKRQKDDHNANRKPSKGVSEASFASRKAKAIIGL